MTTPFGASTRRKEDYRFVTGAGRYVDDMRVAGMLHAAFVRSPHAHARIERIEAAEARSMPGVAAVFTLDDLPECKRPIPPSIPGPASFHDGPQPAFASPIVRYVGEVVAVVIAETPYQAADAVQAVRVEYVPLPAAGTAQAALKPGAPRVFDDWPDNVAASQPRAWARRPRPWRAPMLWWKRALSWRGWPERQ